MVATRICPAFWLTKMDADRMDWNHITEQLGVRPTSAKDAALSKGRVMFYDSAHDEQFPSITILPAKDSPYHPFIRHAFWYFKMAGTEDGHIESASRELELLLQGKGDTIRNLCSQYNLKAKLELQVFCKGDEPAEMTLSAKCMQYWAILGIELNIVILLDEEE